MGSRNECPSEGAGQEEGKEMKVYLGTDTLNLNLLGLMQDLQGNSNINTSKYLDPGEMGL